MGTKPVLTIGNAPSLDACHGWLDRAVALVGEGVADQSIGVGALRQFGYAALVLAERALEEANRLEGMQLRPRMPSPKE